MFNFLGEIMKKIFVIIVILFTDFLLFADGTAVFALKNGKSVSGKIVKIEAASLNGKSISEVKSLNAAQGVDELMIQFKDIKEIVFKSSDDVSCFEDGRFVPVRKFCSQKSLYHLRLKTPSQNKNPIEVTDDRAFYFYIEGKKEPLKISFYKIQVSSEGRENKTDYPDLEKEVVNFSKNGVKKITFK